MKIEISIGEGLDRLSILEIKLRKLTSAEQLHQVSIEIESLNELQPYKSSYTYYYKLMYCINKRIWDLTNIVKQMTTRDTVFVEIAHQIFELNQSRFRVKNIINQLTDSSIREQKSYGTTHISVHIYPNTTQDIIHRYLAYLSISYDIVNIQTDIATQTYIEQNIPKFNYIFNNSMGTSNIDDIVVPDWLVFI